MTPAFHAPRPQPRPFAARLLLTLAALALMAPPASPAAPSPLQGVAAGGDTTCAIFLGGAFCWGYNANGQVGNNSTQTALSPAAVAGLASGVTAISTGGDHSCAVAHGAAWCWGSNGYGQLGDNTIVDRTAPVQVSGLGSGVTAIATGDLFTCAVVNQGVKCWGSGALGQLGNGTTSFNSLVPVDVAGLAAGSGATAVTAGRQHACAIRNGAASCWGRGDSGELGGGASTYINPVPVAVGGFGGGASQVATVLDAGGSFTCGVKNTNAFCWGFGSNGQLGTGSNGNTSTPQALVFLGGGVTTITAGTGLHGCAIEEGVAACWGLNNHGQLGTGAGGGSNIPALVQGLGSGVERIAAGALHTCAIAPAGLFCWGNNAHGQLGNGGQAASATPVLVIAAQVSTTLVASPASLAFDAQSVRTSSPPQSVTITNTGGGTATFTDSAVTEGFDAGTSCATLAPGASCIVSVQFTPTRAGAVSGHVALDSNAGLVVIEASGTGELSLVVHYYRSILRRAPDAGGKSYWEAEAARVSGLGANVNETWYSMAQAFYTSSEYAGFGRDAAGFVTDLYNTFFNRAPDTAGLDYWVSQLQGGMPREVVLASFMFSPEFVAFTQAIFGNTAARAEIDAVMDFYRGLLSRLPDNAGFGYWRQQFRAAQCSGPAAVNAQVEAISSGFALSGEYADRARTPAQYVGDMYNAFLRRGGDLAGVSFWIQQVSSGARTREQVRQAFIATPEFQARVQAIIAAGCVA